MIFGYGVRFVDFSRLDGHSGEGRQDDVYAAFLHLYADTGAPALLFIKYVSDMYVCGHLMRHFATESDKSEMQFYTPAEVSRVMAKVVGVEKAASQSQTVYDPTCGPGSLLLKGAEHLRPGK